MVNLSRAATRVVLLLLCGCSLTSALAVPNDPSLQLYLDFESYEPNVEFRTWVIPDRSHNALDVDLHNLGGLLERVPTGSGWALKSSTINSSYIRSDTVLYEPGEGLTVSVWLRLGSGSWVFPIWIGGDSHLIELSISRGDPDGMLLQWGAYQNDGVTRVFRIGANAKTVPTTNEWTHYVGVYDPDRKLAFIYVDGQEVARGGTAGDPASDWAKPPLGKVEFDIWGSRSGVLIDELRWYSRALSPDEIAEVGEMMWKPSPFGVSAQGKMTTSWGVLKRR